MSPPDADATPLGTTPSDEGGDRIVTAANAITLARLLGLPVFVWLLFSQGDRAAAAALLAVLGATDFADGYVARHFDQGSEFGKMFDPVADRLLFFVAVAAILVDGAAPAWICIAVLVREAVVAGVTVLLAILGAPRIDVIWWGKAGTFGLMVAFPLFLAGSSDLDSAAALEALAWVAVVPGLSLSYYAALQYLPLARRAYAARGGG